MQLDKFMMMDGMLPFDDGDPRIDEWCRVWSKPVNLSLFDTVRMSEQECPAR